MTVSVIIPCHNAEPYVAQTIGSLLEQTRPPEEILVVDDGSTDGSRAIAESFGNPVRVLSKRSGSASRTRIYGTSVATGDALMFLDADDVLGPEALEALVDALERDPGSVASCPWYRLEQKDGRWVRRPASCRPRRPGQDPLEAWLDGWYHPPCAVLWSRSAYEQAGGWDPDVTLNDDGDLMMRALVQGVPLRLTERGTAFYRRLPEGAVSLSGKRLTHGGLESWASVIARIGQMLEARGALAPYRRALGDAFKRLAADAAEHHPDLVGTCVAHRQRYGEPAGKVWVRDVYRRIGGYVRRARHKVRRVGEVLTPPRQPPAPEPVDEVRFGLRSSKAVAEVS